MIGKTCQSRWSCTSDDTAYTPPTIPLIRIRSSTCSSISIPVSSLIVIRMCLKEWVLKSWTQTIIDRRIRETGRLFHTSEREYRARKSCQIRTRRRISKETYRICGRSCKSEYTIIPIIGVDFGYSCWSEASICSTTKYSYKLGSICWKCSHMSISAIDIKSCIGFDEYWSSKCIYHSTWTPCDGTLIRISYSSSLLPKIIILILMHISVERKGRVFLPYSIKNDDRSSISIISDSPIDRCLDSSIYLLQTLGRDFIRETHLYSTLIDTYSAPTVVSSSIMDIFLYIRECFLIYNFMESLQVADDRTSRLYVWKCRDRSRIHTLISYSRSCETWKSRCIGILWSFICLSELWKCKWDIS